MWLKYGTEHLIVGIGIATLSWAQSLDVSGCIGPLTAAPNCNSYGSILTSCDNLVGSAAASCYCPQTVFDALVRCEGEFRICYASDYFDSSFDAPGSGLFALWHSACDGRITYTVTTPAAAEPSATIDIDYCNSVNVACNRWGKLTDDCTMSYTANSDILNCWCQSSVLSLASSCQIGVTSSCLLSSVITSSLWSYSYCRNGPSAEARPMTSTPTATFVPTPSTAVASTLPSVPVVLASSTGLSSVSAGIVEPNLGHVVAAIFSLGLVIFVS